MYAVFAQWCFSSSQTARNYQRVIIFGMFLLTREVDQPIMVLYVNHRKSRTSYIFLPPPCTAINSSHPKFLGPCETSVPAAACAVGEYSSISRASAMVPALKFEHRSSNILHTIWWKRGDCMEIPHKWRLIAGIIIGKLLNILQKWRFVAGNSHRKIWGTLGIAEARHAETKPWICLPLRWKPWLVQAGESQWDVVNLTGNKKTYKWWYEWWYNTKAMVTPSSP